MNWKTTLVLIVLAGAAVWGVLQLQQRNRQAATPTTHAALEPGLESQLNDITALRISTGGNQLVAELKRTDAGWVVANKHSYPADLATIRRLLLALAQARIVETKTSDPKLYHELDVADIGDQKAQGVQLEIDGLKQPIKLVIGKAAPRSSDETYVRPAGQAQSLLVSASLKPPKKADRWLQQPLLDLPADTVQQVVIHHPDGRSLTLERKTRDQDDLKPATLPPGRELSYATVANPVGSVVTSLQLQDVVPVSQLDPGKQKDTVTTVYTLFDGETVTFTAFKHGGHDYVHLRAGFDRSEYDRFAPKPARPAADKNKAGGQQATGANDKTDGKSATKSKSGEQDKHSPAAIAAKAKALDQRLEDWVFQIASYKYENLTKTLDDLLKPAKPASQNTTGSRAPARSSTVPLNPQAPAASSQTPAPSGQ